MYDVRITMYDVGAAALRDVRCSNYDVRFGSCRSVGNRGTLFFSRKGAKAQLIGIWLENFIE
jgi:hypothetical protein